MKTLLGHRGRLAFVLVLIAGIAATATALAGGSKPRVVSYRAGAQKVYGVRPTGVGLPNVGESGTVGADALAPALRAYHDSGAYERDLSAVDGSARGYLAQRLRSARSGRRVCLTAYRRLSARTQRALRQRMRRCRLRKKPLSRTPAIVLDIDETALSNYADLSSHNFDASALNLSAVAGHGTAIRPTLRLYRDAIAHGVKVFFITGRPPLIDTITKSNLRRAGFDRGWGAIYEKPVSAQTESFKSTARAALVKRGYDIIANVGDQQSDLDGGHADRDFKLPDPF